MLVCKSGSRLVSEIISDVFSLLLSYTKIVVLIGLWVHAWLSDENIQKNNKIIGKYSLG